MKHFYVFAIIYFLSNTLNAQTLYSIICGDIETADVKNTCQKDIDLVNNMATELSRAAVFGHKVKKLTKAQFTTTALDTYLNSLDLNSEDVILFYFTGHGVAGTLKFKNGDLTIKALEKKLEAKNAQLTIITLDRCDKAVVKKRGKSKGVKSKYKIKKGNRKTANAHKLLCSVEGTYTFYSAEDGHYSYAPKNGNSYFTYAWVEEINNILADKNSLVSWNNVLKNTQDNLQEKLGDYVNVKMKPKSVNKTERRATFNPKKKAKTKTKQN